MTCKTKKLKIGLPEKQKGARQDAWGKSHRSTQFISEHITRLLSTVTIQQVAAPLRRGFLEQVPIVGGASCSWLGGSGPSRPCWLQREHWARRH